MVELRKPISVEVAVKKVIESVKSVGMETVPIEDSDDRILAEDIKADHDVPPFDRSPYDGFAVWAEDTAGASDRTPISLKVIEEIGAGQVAKNSVKQGEAIRIMTGATLPDGANAVIMLEHVNEIESAGQAQILIDRQLRPRENISAQGEDTKKGALLVEKGRMVTPGVKALLATFGYAKVAVYRKPVVGIFATGTELLDVDEPLQPGKIRDSNAHMIVSQIRKAGAIPRYYGKAIDDIDTCYREVRKVLDEVDVLITTGGVSVGDYDYVPEIYKRLEAEVLFNKIAMRPGSVTTVATWRGKTLFGLSGNPSACFVGFELLARPLLQKMLGAVQPFLAQEQAELGHDFLKANPFTRFVRGKVLFEGGRLYAYPTGMDKSNIVTSLAEANALIVLQSGTQGLKKGRNVDVLLLNEAAGDWQVGGK